MLEWLRLLAPLARSPDGWAMRLVLLLVEVTELAADSASSLRGEGDEWASDAHVDGAEAAYRSMRRSA